jgi:uncharacterized protein YbaP (TraB family)
MIKRAGTYSLRLVFLLLFLISLVPARAVSAGDHVFMWKVDSPKATVYILGTIHMMKKEMYPLDKRIENAFGKSDAYALEFNIDDNEKVRLDTLINDINYTGDDSIRKHISLKTYDSLREKFVGYGLPAEYMDKFKPWFLALMIESLEYQKLGLDPEYGLDKHFLRKAEGSKSIIELESFDSQMDLFRTMSDTDQELLLIYTLKDMDDSGKNMDAMLDAWSSGDFETIARLVNDPLKEDHRLSGIYEKLFFDRNRNMTGKIVEMLSRKGTYFVAVGAGHLVGSRGIIEMLSRQGYQVIQQ